jgi:hypothetical protein
MKPIKLFEEFINEVTLPKHTRDFAKKLGGIWTTDKDDYDISVFKGKSKFKILYNQNKDMGAGKYQIFDEKGNEIYFGNDPYAAYDAMNK